MGKGRPWWIALGGVGLAAVLVAGAVVQRRVLAERALVRWLAARGITASPRITRFGLGGLEVRDVVLGTAEAPDLAIDGIAVRWSVASLIGRRATSVEVLGARLRIRWDAERPSAGALDALLLPSEAPASSAPGLPIERVELYDLRIDVDTPAGVVSAHGDIDVVEGARGPHARGALQAETPWGAVSVTGDADLAVGPAWRWKAALTAAVLEWPGVGKVTGATVRGRGAGRAIRARFAAARATATGTPAPIEPLRLAGTLGGSIERLVIDATVATLADGLVLNLSGPVEPLAARAELGLRLAETSLDGVKPARLLPPLAGRVTRLAGTVGGAGHVRYRDGTFGAEFSLALRDVDVVAKLATVRRASGVITMIGPPGLVTPPGQTIAMAAIDGALPLQDGTVVFRLEPGGVLGLERAEWRLAGGRLRASGRVPLGADERTVTLVVDSLDVETLLASLAFEGLSGTGTLSGTLPLRQRGGELLVEQGHLEATSPGTLHYRRPTGAEAAGTGHGQLDLLLAVLEDFHYDELALALSGDTAAPMDMTLHVRGRNPDYQHGRPVVFNVHVEAPLAGLVREAGSTYRMPVAIEKRLESMGMRGTK